MRTARTALLILALTATYASSALAQSTPPNFLVEFEGQFGASAEKFVALAKAMPEESYGWRPMEGVRLWPACTCTLPATLLLSRDRLGRALAMGAAEYDSWEAGVADKEKAVAILAESMEHVRRVVAAMSSKDLEKQTRLYGAMSASGRSFSSS